MKFKQYEDGACDIIFSEEEKNIIYKNKKLHFPAKTFKHFGNVLMKMVIDWNLKFKDDVKNAITEEDTVIRGTISGGKDTK